MNENGVKRVCGVIADEMREGDIVCLTVSVRDGKYRMSLNNAPSWVLEPIIDGGYYASAGLFGVSITDEEE